jgi:hypothetical protein
MVSSLSLFAKAFLDQVLLDTAVPSGFGSFMKAPSSLCPGYKQVESFGPYEEYDDEEEVCYVTLDMGNVEPTLVPSSSSYRLIVSAS